MLDEHGLAKTLTLYVLLLLVGGGLLGVGCWEGSKWVYRHVHVEVSK